MFVKNEVALSVFWFGTIYRYVCAYIYKKQRNVLQNYMNTVLFSINFFKNMYAGIYIFFFLKKI